MSHEITRIARLTALVLDAPPCPYLPSAHGLQGPTTYCALRRAAASLDWPSGRNGNGSKFLWSDELYEVTRSLGFSECEARGIMNGWDRKAGLKHAFACADPEMEALGSRLWDLVHEAPPTTSTPT